LLTIADVFGRGEEVVDICQDARRDGQECFAVLGCESSTLGAFEQLDAKHLFECLNPST
jgi:hypothetical protein